MPERPCSPDFPFKAPPPARPVPRDDAPSSFAAMDRAAESAPSLKPILPCEKPYVELSFFDESAGTPIRGSVLKLELGGGAQERPLDGSATYRVDDTQTDVDALVPVVFAELREGDVNTWRVVVSRDLTPMEEGQPPQALPLESAPEAPWEPFGEAPWFKE